ncbi:hypothetical protein LshimejAT787_1300990 [Lyophyllum shimeji]|uniref:Uncharacterized protein n=1 Tax=Lyophyllum shimeji TaxID=47721 RepID=A0A9P3PWC8_LYOSH|nr:hypothetical protein LshimejAT787_1300990 [Lyophyllum shimeji]
MHGAKRRSGDAGMLGRIAKRGTACEVDCQPQQEPVRLEGRPTSAVRRADEFCASDPRACPCAGIPIRSHIPYETSLWNGQRQ